MELIRLQKRGALTIPSAMRRRLCLSAGQAMAIRVIDDRHLSLEVLPSLSADELFARFPITEPVEDAGWRREMGDTMATERRIGSGDCSGPRTRR